MSETPTRMIMIHDLVNPETGLTYKQENLKKQHAIPIGTLVEVKWDAYYGEGACMKYHGRLWVVRHDRDCDGTPLYSLSRWNVPGGHGDLHTGMSEERLTPVEMTSRVTEGWDVLSWDDE